MPSTAIVTGYSAGLGEQFTAKLLERGWRVIGVSRETEPAPLHEKHGDSLIAVHGSVDDQAVADQTFAVAAEVGGLALVINCAGEGVFGEIGSYSADDIRAALSANLAGLMLFSDMAITALRDEGGDIVNVMSTASKKLRTAESVYVASKWGAKGYTRTLREAVKTAKLPIRVFEVYPCGMNTRFWEAATRPVASRENFPIPDPIADQVLEELENRRGVYCQEFTYERS